MKWKETKKDYRALLFFCFIASYIAKQGDKLILEDLQKQPSDLLLGGELLFLKILLLFSIKKCFFSIVAYICVLYIKKHSQQPNEVVHVALIPIFSALSG